MYVILKHSWVFNKHVFPTLGKTTSTFDRRIAAAPPRPKTLQLDPDLQKSFGMYAENTQEYLNPAKDDKIGPGSLENASINRRLTQFVPYWAKIDQNGIKIRPNEPCELDEGVPRSNLRQNDGKEANLGSDEANQREKCPNSVKVPNLHPNIVQFVLDRVERVTRF